MIRRSLAALLLAAVPAVAAAETAESTLSCGGAKVVLTTACSGLVTPGWPACQRQALRFVRHGERHVVRPASGGLVPEPGVPAGALDVLAVRWVCARNEEGGHYVAVEYTNGGTCGDCRRIELYDLAGRNLTPDGRGVDRIAQRVGLTAGWTSKLTPVTLPLVRVR